MQYTTTESKGVKSGDQTGRLICNLYSLETECFFKTVAYNDIKLPVTCFGSHFITKWVIFYISLAVFI
jgi:hypothetical protein